MTALRSGIRRTTLALPVVLFALLALAAPGFLAPQNLANIIGQITALLIVSLGQMLVALVAGIDLSVGSVMSLAGSLVATQADPLLGIGLALLLGLLVGVVNGLGVAVAGIHPLIMTLATATFLQGLAYLVLPIPGGEVPASLRSLVNGTLWGVPQPLLWCALCAGAVALLLHHTRLGLHLFAVGAQARSAQLNGVPVVAVTVSAYVACSLLAVVAGIYLAARVASGDPTMGASFGLESVTAVALGGVQLTGGVGSVLGVVTGALSLGLMTNGINLFGISPFLRGALTGVLLLAAVCAQRRKVVGL
ncbi:ABC transporter permease [Thauera aminoaromatica]|mgnify:FL=1|jgi:ribose transport system permease protein|uniref:ABC transporter permease n=1 Tax=Thauera aminoaromatica TaxID=164330 RepID=A0A5C7T1S2_THASP|nr:ABC transporter permease [Thauera aminoaromatica]TXH89216.1 MAG: ABC transporter permease [Thauera aminoaromatica]